MKINPFFLILSLFVSLNGKAQYGQLTDFRPEIHCEHFFYGYPYGSPKTNDLIIRDIYALSNNDETKFADWVCYRLSLHEVDGDLTIERDWKADPWLEEKETLEPKPDDYKDANKTSDYDRGHQAPLASFKGSRHASHTNFLSNITPQKADLNQGPWEELESMVRNLVKATGEVYVMTGPVYQRAMPALPNADEPHKVPSGYWKIVAIEQKEQIQIAAFFFDQETPRSDKVYAHLVTVDEIEMMTGLDFFWELNQQMQNVLENQINRPFADMYFK